MGKYLEYVRVQHGARGALRNRLRTAVLNGLSKVQKDKSGNFARCFCFHYVFDDQQEMFADQLDILAEIGEFVTGSEFASISSGSLACDGRYFHITFDDALTCVADNAYPILLERGIPATVFVNSCMANPDPQDEVIWRQATNYLPGIPVMNWNDIRRIAASAGWQIGAHGRTHTSLAKVSSNARVLRGEIFDCKSEIEKNIPGYSCDLFAWPFGGIQHIDGLSLEAIKQAGFEACFSLVREQVVPGVTDPFLIPRHHIEPHWPLGQLRFFALGGLERARDYSSIQNAERRVS